MSSNLKDTVREAFRRRCSASSEPSARRWEQFLESANSEALVALGRGEIPSDAQMTRMASTTGISGKDYRWLSAELWLAAVNEANPKTVGAELVDSRVIGEQIKRNKRTLSSYFLIGRSIHFWWKGMVGDYLTSDDRLYAAITYHLIVSGCRIFASRQELADAIISEQWDYWQEWHKSKGDIPQ